MRMILLFLLLTAAGISWWWVQGYDQDSRSKATLATDSIDYFVSGLDLKRFNPQGILTQRLKASHLKHYLLSEQSHLNDPDFVLFNNDQPLWHIVARSGRLSADQQRLNLHEDALITRFAHEENQADMQISSSTLNLDMQKEYMDTADPVTLTQQQNWIQSVGMQAWLRPPGAIHFLAQTKAYYVLNPSSP